MDDKIISKLVDEFAEAFKDKRLGPRMIKLREDYVPKLLTIPRKVSYARC